ncbi:BsuBI/PstI family type II restriction endonuclease [Paenibacillus sp. WLX2291]|uniref:BsuBI/PstI family type II restriction endonuclease n=1 Tax=Paenibacillus sp. WLX2291 TaxID=3296934 RepID=UPI003983DD68
MTSIIQQIDKIRIEINSSLTKKNELSQFFTPYQIADFMVSLFDEKKLKSPCLLDAGAGIGSLSGSFLNKYSQIKLDGEASVTAVEIDEMLKPILKQNLNLFHDDLNLDIDIISADFIEWSINILQSDYNLFPVEKLNFSHVILNPPYKKISSTSLHRKLLRNVGIETGNLYSAFVALAINLLQENGELVAIIPRSFCNGPYFKTFRKLILDKTAIKHIHLFKSRNSAFHEDKVLQENIIISLEKGTKQENVLISTSTDASFSDYIENSYEFSRIVQPLDTELFIHVPTNSEPSFTEKYPSVHYSLSELGIEVSTGPVVDFRVKEYLRNEPETNSVPLFYPNHFSGTSINWPKIMKKPNALIRNIQTEKSLYPNGYYTVIKRFSSKEEKRRIVAGVLNPNTIDYSVIGFENGLNVFHINKNGLVPEIAYGLFAYLNSLEVDNYFRVFNGHTQVNATDLRTMKYPSKDIIFEIGKWILENINYINQDIIDQKVKEFLLMQDTHPHIVEAIKILKMLGFPKEQLNDRSALCLLALINLTPEKSWEQANNPLIGITPIMNFALEEYAKKYAPNTRETFRRYSMHQFVSAGLALYNPDKPDRPVNSPKAVYQIAPAALELIKKYNSAEWHIALATYLASITTLVERYAKEREQNKLPVRIEKNKSIYISPGEHSELIKSIIEDFAPRYVPNGQLIYVGDTGDKIGYFDVSLLNSLGVSINLHGKMPDVVIYYPEKNWLLLIESVTSHGPVDGKRHEELAKLFKNCIAGIVYVTAFPNRSAMTRYLSVIAWETEVWVADAPSHLIHFNGTRFLGPYNDE